MNTYGIYFYAYSQYDIKSITHSVENTVYTYQHTHEAHTNTHLVSQAI